MPSKLIASALGDSEVVNTVTETSLASMTIPANTLGTDQLLVVRAMFDFVNNSAAAKTFTMRVKFAGTTIVIYPSISVVVHPDRRAQMIELFLGGGNATNSQTVTMLEAMGGASSGAGGGIGGGNDRNQSVNSPAIDQTADRTLEITVQLSAADVNFAVRRRGVWVELIGNTAGAGSTILTPSGGDTEYNTDATYHSVYSVTIPAGTLSTGNLLAMHMIADWLNNTGTNQSCLLRVKWGGVTLFDITVALVVATSASRRAYPLVFWLGGAGATNAQAALVIEPTDSAPGADAGTVNTNVNMRQGSTVATVDSTADQTLEVLTKLSAADVNLKFRFRSALVQVLKAS